MQKKLWNVLNFLLGKNDIPEKIEPEELNQEKVNNFNKYFANIGIEIQKELDIDFDYENNKEHNFQPFKFENENEKDIEKIIDNIKKDVATGPDSIPAKIIKETKNIIGPFITKIINLSYETNTFPDILKKAIIKPIHKKKR